jgi:hypothetical protein
MNNVLLTNYKMVNVCGVFVLPPGPPKKLILVHVVSASSTQSLISLFVWCDRTEIVTCYYDLALGLPYAVLISSTSRYRISCTSIADCEIS